jgi:DNA-binding protein HU-beta
MLDIGWYFGWPCHLPQATGGSSRAIPALPADPTEEIAMNKTELVSELARRTDLTQKDAGAVLDAFLDVVADVVAKGEEKLVIPGYLTIEQGHRSARTARNPQTGETINVPATNTAKISAGSTLKKAAAGK